MNPAFITQLEPPVSLEKTEPPLIIKNEPFESDIMENGIDDIPDSSHEGIIPDIKDDIDVVWHMLCEDSIKSETVPTNILESKHSESVETQVLVKTENDTFVKIINITEIKNLYKTEDTSDGNSQQVVEVQDDLNGINRRSQQPKHPGKTDFAKRYRTSVTTSWEAVEKKIKVIKPPLIPVEPHEYISLAIDNHICNHCQCAFNKLSNLKLHIREKHRKVTPIYQCPCCYYKSKWRRSLMLHITHKHEDIECFPYCCDMCDYKTFIRQSFKKHKLIHLKPEEIQYFYCYRCSFKTKHKGNLKSHIFSLHFKNVEIKQKRKKRNWYHCDQCDYKTYKMQHLNRHKLIHLKPEEIQYFYCYHCSNKYKQKLGLKRHILRHCKKGEIKLHNKCDETKYTRKQQKGYDCDKCNFKTKRHAHLRRHNIIHLKPEEIQYFYCYHCSHKSKQKDYLKIHIFRHFKREDITFHCYICDFMTLKRDLIIDHIKKHSKVKIKSVINRTGCSAGQPGREPRGPHKRGASTNPNI